MAAHKPLQAPAHTRAATPTAASTFLLAWLSYFVESSDPDLDSHKSKANAPDFAALFDQYFSDDAVVQFPYLPRGNRGFLPIKPLTTEEEDGGKLEGRTEILTYFQQWRSTFWFSSGDIKTLSTLATDSNEAVLEARLHGKLLHGAQPKEYVQDYVSFVKVNESGKVIEYREHWAANRFI